MAQTVRIDFVSDVVCPWCVVGLRSLQTALARLDGVVDADIHLQPFELNPDMAPEGENTTAHVQNKYGASRERSEATRNALKEAGEAFGFAFNYTPDSRIWNTFYAHRLLHWAEAEGKALALKEAGLNYPGQGWWGLAAPKGTPAPIVDKVNAAFVSVFSDPKFAEFLAKQEVVPAPTSPAAFTAFLKEDRKAAEDLVKIANTPKQDYKPQ